MRAAHIVVTCSTAHRARRDKLAGVVRAARKLGWRLHVVDRHPFSPSLDDILAQVVPDGFILENDDAAAGGIAYFRRRFPKVPRVFMDASPQVARSGNVLLDAVSVANCAAEHLASLGVSSYAYVGVSGRPFWDAQREAAFAAAMRRRGATVKVFRPGPSARRGAAALRRFLLSLPRPCAVFAAFDAVAREVVDACAAAGLSVPDDVAVLGCDDDAFICENSYPTISSILPDWQRCGEMAVERLLRRIDGGGAGAATKYGVVCVSVRESTRLLSARSAVVKRALAFIAENVTSGISASGVALALDIPLRTLEYRFRRELGRTVSAEIQERRLGAVERMLADRNVRIESIAQMCGYRSDVNLKKQFKKRFGLSMREWRKGVSALA